MSNLLSPRGLFLRRYLLRRLSATAALTFCALTMANGAEPLSPFGIGACNQTSQELEKWIPQMEEIGVHVMRTCRVMWGGVERVEGTWDWAEVDRQMLHRQNAFGIVRDSKSANDRFFSPQLYENAEQPDAF